MTRQQATNSPEFRAIYNRFREVSFEARHIPIEDLSARRNAFGPNSEYAELLVQLGRRLPTDSFPVGESPKHVAEGGSYIQTVVLPALAAGRIQG